MAKPNNKSKERDKPSADYGPEIRDSIMRYAGGSHLRSQTGNSREDELDRNGLPYQDPELRMSAQGRSMVGHFDQGEALRQLRKDNPDLTDYGAQQTMKVGAKKSNEAYQPLDSYKNGTPFVPKTGVYKLHKGERVVPASKNRKLRKNDPFYGG